ncbi:MAG: DNA/RNA non-specific endonuclease [Lewinellaceae bacterium]|nr:DNA/RNA non-specific endonuclease [Lewinellaceae bacterium]
MASENGYQPTFIGKNLKVDLPVLGSEKHHEPAPVKGEEKALLTYPHFSVALSKLRKLPLYAAVNIDGKKFQEITRTDLFGGSDRWSVDPRAGEYQWGNDLYSASGSEFDKAPHGKTGRTHNGAKTWIRLQKRPAPPSISPIAPLRWAT